MKFQIVKLSKTPGVSHLVPEGTKKTLCGRSLPRKVRRFIHPFKGMCFACKRKQREQAKGRTLTWVPLSENVILRPKDRTMNKKPSVKIRPVEGSLAWYRKEWERALVSKRKGAEMLAQLSYENKRLRRRLNEFEKRLEALDEHFEMTDKIQYQMLMDRGQEQVRMAWSTCDCFSCVQARLKNRES